MHTWSGKGGLTQYQIIQSYQTVGERILGGGVIVVLYGICASRKTKMFANTISVVVIVTQVTCATQYNDDPASVEETTT